MSYRASNYDPATTEKAIRKRVPQRLVDIVRLSGQASQGFYNRSGLEASRDFSEGVFNRLHEQGWAVYGQRRVEGKHFPERVAPLNGVEVNDALQLTIEGMLESLATYYDRNRRDHVAASLSYSDDSKQAVDFLFREESMDTLEKAIRDSAAVLIPAHGDPFVVRYDTEKRWTALFNAAAIHKPFSLLNVFRGKASQEAYDVENELVRTLKDVLVRMRKFHALRIPGIEFQGRVNERLREKGWPIPPHKEGRYRERALPEMLWGLAHEAEIKTTLPLRVALQNDTEPPRPWEREAKDFILAHPGDIAEAAAAVDKEMEREMLIPGGLQPRYFKYAKPGDDPLTDAIGKALNGDKGPTAQP